MTYPIMTGNHEVVSPIGSVPKGISIRHQVHVISNVTPQRIFVEVRVGIVQVLNHPGYAEGHEVNVSAFPIFRPEFPWSLFHLVYEPTFNGVQVLAWPIVSDW